MSSHASRRLFRGAVAQHDTLMGPTTTAHGRGARSFPVAPSVACVPYRDKIISCCGFYTRRLYTCKKDVPCPRVRAAPHRWGVSQRRALLSETDQRREATMSQSVEPLDVHREVASEDSETVSRLLPDI